MRHPRPDPFNSYATFPCRQRSPSHPLYPFRPDLNVQDAGPVDFDRGQTNRNTAAFFQRGAFSFPIFSSRFHRASRTLCEERSAMDARPPAVVGRHVRFAAGVPPVKEDYISSSSLPWYRQKKWRMFMLVAAIFFIGIVVGGIVGGIVASRVIDENSQSVGTEASTVMTLPTSTSSSLFGSPAQSTSGDAAAPSESTSIAGAVPTSSSS